MKTTSETLGRIFLFLGVPLITVITWFSGTDPVNLPKAVLLSCLAGALFGFLAWNIKTIPKKALFIVFFFWTSFIPPMLFSGAPVEQQLFGVYGRNTGLVTYFSLSIIFLAAATFSTKTLAQKFVIGLVIAGSINLIISIFQINDIE